MSGLMHYGGICPVIKHLWTPSWVFLSGGMCFLMLAGFYQIIDVKQIRGWTFPFLVLGMNSIAIYLMRHTLDEWLAENLQRHFGSATFQILGPEFEPMLLGICSFALLWLVLLWMYRRKLFLRV
jgi:heparan-alpha-glucosaminide N-acetyltransferase